MDGFKILTFESLAENVSWHPKLKSKFNRKYTGKVVREHAFLDDLNKLEETNRYYNWYHGYTKVYEPSTTWEKNGDYDIETSATSGSISTQYFGQKYQSHLVRKWTLPLVRVYPPKSACESENITFHFKLEKVSITGLSLSNGRDEYDMDGYYGELDAEEPVFYKNFSPPSCLFYDVSLVRDIRSLDLR